MKIISEKTKYHTYALEFPFDWKTLEFCRSVKEKYGWKEFTYFENKWRFKNPLIAAYIYKNFSGVLLDDYTLSNQIGNLIEALDKEVINTKIAEESATKIDTDFVVNNVKGNLYGYQKVAVEFLYKIGGRGLLSLDIGCGKSLCSLAYAAHTGYKNIIVVCPASMKLSWDREVKKWTNYTSFVIDSTTDAGDIPDAEVIIINYDILKKFIHHLVQCGFDCMIVDESQCVKEKTAIRSKMVKQLSSGIKSVLMLSGTPLINRPMDLFNQLNIIDPITWNNWYSYAVKFCGGHRGRFGFEAKGATNIPELKKQISRYFIRFKKEDVLKDLPPKVFIDVPVAMCGDHKKKYDLAMSSLVQWLKEGRGKTDAEALKSMRAEQIVRLNELRQITTLCKSEQASDLIQNIIDADEKVIVFSMFNAPLKRLHEEFRGESVLLLGETPVEERQKAMDAFQNDPKTKIFFGGTKAAGVGITLTAASNVVFLEMPWTGSDFAQAYGRAERIGNKSECIKIHQMSAENTIDEKITQLVKSKQALFDQIFDGGSAEADLPVADEIIKNIKQQNNI